MNSGRNRICPAERAWGLEIGFRRWLQNPQKILSPYVFPGQSVLDVGCGPGFFAIEMARLVGPAGRVIAVDLQEGMLEKVRRKIADTELAARMVLQRCDANRLVVSGPMDFALAFWVVHELPDSAGFFRELAALLKSGAKALVAEPPFHVSKTAFAATVRGAEAAGFVSVPPPKIVFSRVALLQKTPLP